MAVILAHPAASHTVGRGRRAACDIPLPAPRPHQAAVTPRGRSSLLLLGVAPLLLANASWDAVTFLGGAGAHARPVAHVFESACA